MSLAAPENPSPYLNVDFTQGVLSLKINRPDAKNALDDNLYLTLVHYLTLANEQQQILAVVLRGMDKDFTAGNDMHSFAKMMNNTIEVTPGDLPPFLLLKAAANLNKPLIIAVKGVAIGIGVTILLHADWVFADDSAIFQLPFIRLGLSPEGGSSQMLSERAGPLLATRLLIEGERFNVNTAHDAKLITTIAKPEQDVYELAQKKAIQLTELPANAVQQSKKIMQVNRQRTIDLINQEAVLFVKRTQSEELKEALTAFQQKRVPNFQQFNFIKSP